jgi:hypothetical protein
MHLTEKRERSPREKKRGLVVLLDNLLCITKHESICNSSFMILIYNLIMKARGIGIE